MGTRRDVASRRSAPSGHVATTTLQRGPFSRCQKVPFLLAISNHAPSGEWADHRDCHVKPALVLIYQKPDADTLRLVRLGSHAQPGF